MNIYLRNKLSPYLLRIFFFSFATLLAGMFLGSSVSASTLMVTDTFSRSVSGGWGNSDNGISYTTNSTNFSVNGSEGALTFPAHSSLRSAAVDNLELRDVEMQYRFKMDKVAEGSSPYAGFEAREISGNDYYRIDARQQTNGNLVLRAVSVVGGTQTTIGSEVFVFALAADQYVHLKTNVSGTFPTTIKFKAWLDGQAEPGGWQYEQTDSSAVLQSAGGVSVRANTSSATSNFPVLFTFDDFKVFDLLGDGATSGVVINASVATHISVATNPSLSIEVTPTNISGRTSTQSDTVLVTTNSSSGYSLSLSNDDENQNLVQGSNNIVPHTATPASPSTLALNSWGFRVDGVAGFGAGPTSIETDVTDSAYTWAAVPALSSPTTVKTTGSTAEDDSTVFWYGVNINSSIPSGEYSDVIRYTAVANP